MDRAWLHLLGALVIAQGVVPSQARAASPPPFFYELRLNLKTGEALEGQGWLWFLGSLGERKLETVELAEHPDGISATVRYPGVDASRSLVLPVSATGPGWQQDLYASHERFAYPFGTFYLPSGKRSVPLASIARIDARRVIGRGQRIAGDPHRYRDLPQPHIEVSDCGLGCTSKLHSDDPSLNAEALRELWDEHFSCATRGSFHPYNQAAPADWGDPEKFALFQRHRLELVADPLCLD